MNTIESVLDAIEKALENRACIYLDTESIQSMYLTVGEGLIESILHIGKERWLVLTPQASKDIPPTIEAMAEYSREKLFNLISSPKNSYTNIVLLNTPCW